MALSRLVGEPLKRSAQNDAHRLVSSEHSAFFGRGECNGFYLATPQVILFISPCSKEARSAIPVGEEKAVANSILAVGEPLSYPCNERVYALA
jgi:hypothetical protein